MMSHERYFIVKWLSERSQNGSGWIILMRRKTAHEDCNINKISKHLPIDLKFSGYILEHMEYDIAKTKLFGFT
jgi:hypothetical protein